MPSVVTQPIGSALDNYAVTLAVDYDLVEAVRRVGASVDLSSFLAEHPSGSARIWAVGVSKPALRAWSRMEPGDLVLFYANNEVCAYGTLASKTTWRKNNHIWPSGSNWDHVYSLKDFHEIPEGARVVYQSLRTLAPKLDVQPVGCRDISEWGGSLSAVREWVRSTGPRKATKTRPPKATPAVVSSSWDIAPGTTLLRREVHTRYGGSRQSGISPSAKSRNVFVFSDLETGKKFGYDKHEGRHEDGSYRYTGEGQIGNQTLKSNGNAALLSAETKDRSIRLFKTDGTSATYIGEYTLGDPPYRVERALDRDNKERNVLVFNLMPTSDEAAPNKLSKTSLGGLLSNRVVFSPWQAPDDSPIDVPESGKVVGGTTISRGEMKLQREYGDWLKAHGKEVESLSIPIEGGAVTMRPDLFNKTDQQVIEAKKSSGRQFVREAIGQVLDYRNNLQRCDNPVNASAVILLPAKPAIDLLELCTELGILVVHRESGGFVAANTIS